MSTSSSSSKPSGQWQPPTLEEMQAMLPQYQFESLLGRGGMGAVYKAVQVSLDRPVAIKVLPVDLIDNEDSQFAERFKNEARTMARMNHPSIVDVYDFGETQTGLLYIVMEFINGTDVSQMIISQGKLPEDYALSITAHVCDALNYAHTHGIIHRDIKPANILINMEGAVKVADFGLAKASDAGQSGLTKTNMAMGTPDFVAPEALIPGIPLDGRADLYAVGVMLYQMLTGEIPRGIWTLPGKKLGTDPRFDSIITKAMQSDRDHRYQSAADLRRDLDTILTLPRAALIAHQQAAAEAAAKASRMQRQQAAPHDKPAATVKKKASPVGPVLGLAFSVTLVAGLYVMLTGDTSKKSTPNDKAAATRGPTQVQTPNAVSTPPPTLGPAASSRFAGVEFPRDLRLPNSASWQFRGEELVCADTKTNEYPSFAIPQEVKNGFECEMGFSFDPAALGYLKIIFPTVKGWGSVQLHVNKVVVYPSGGRQEFQARLDDGAKHVIKVRIDSASVLAVTLDNAVLVNTQDEGVEELRFWNGLQPAHVHIGGETKGGDSSHKIHSIRLVPLDEPAIAAGSLPMTTAPPANPAIPPGWTDLLAEVDVKRDAVNGRWEMTPEGLTVKREHGVRALEFNRDAPEEYDFEIEFTVTDGYSDVGQLLSVAGRTLRWKMAQGIGEFYSFGPTLDGKRPDDPERTEAVVKRKHLKVGQRYRSTVEVRNGSLRALLDGEEVLRWSGDLQRMSDENSSTARDGRHLGLTCYATAVTFHKAVVRPTTGGVPVATPVMSVASTAPVMPTAIPATPSPAPPVTPPSADPLPPGWTDLLAKADPAQGAVTGQWQKGPDGLVVKAQQGVLPFDLNQVPSEQYDFEMDFTVHSSEPDVAQILPLPGGHWFIARLTLNNCHFGPMLDGQQPIERKEAYAPEAKLAQGRRYRSLVQVRKDSVRLVLDEKETIVFNGDLKRLTPDGQFALRNTANLGVASHQSDVTFHRIGFRPHDPSRMDKKDKDTLIASDSRLAQFEAGFQTRYQADAEKPFLVALAKLNRSYIDNGIAKARAAAQARGSLKEIVALDAEKARVEKGEGVPAEDPADTPESLKTLRTTYRAAQARITAERDAKAVSLYDLYLNALDAYVAELTKANKLDDARKVQAMRADIASQRPQTSAIPVVALKPTTTTPAASAPPTKPAAPTGSTWRTAAEFLVSNGGSFVASKNGVNSQVLTAKEIPAGRFDIIELNLDRLNSVMPPLKTPDMAALNGLRDLRRVTIRPVQPGLDDAAFAFLADNDELNWLSLEGVPDVTDALLPHLASAKKLDYLAIQYATKFTGQGLDKIAGASSITNLEMLACGITDEGLRAISTFKKLQNLRTSSTNITAAGFATLTNLKTLTSLNLSGTAFDDEAAGFISSMTGLTNLDLGGTKITDAGLAKLKTLKKLTGLNLGGTAVTPEAAAEFQKVMPQCRVNR